VIETGTARGGSLTLSASVLALLELAEAIEDGRSFDPSRPKRRVIGIDIDIRLHNRAAILAHPFAASITMVEGSSVASDVIDQVRRIAAEHRRIVVLLDSNHTHEHVLSELRAYAPLVTPGSYCVVFDTIIEDMPVDTYPDRPWGRGIIPRRPCASISSIITSSPSTTTSTASCSPASHRRTTWRGCDGACGAQRSVSLVSVPCALDLRSEQVRGAATLRMVRERLHKPAVGGSGCVSGVVREQSAAT
jgi:hypothetical protein